MGRKGNLAVFESNSISETKETTPTKIGVHACDINPYLNYSPWVEREIWPFLKVAVSSKPESSDFDRLNFLMTMDYSPWVEREIWPFLRVTVSLKPKRPHPPKLVYMYVTSIHTCMNFLG